MDNYEDVKWLMVIACLYGVVGFVYDAVMWVTGIFF